MFEISHPLRQRDCAGFTLIEVMIAIFVLSIGILALQQMQVAAIEGNRTAEMLTAGSTRGADRAEQLLNIQDSANAWVNDANNNGIGGLGNTTVNGVVTADFVASQFDNGNAVVDVVTNNGQALPANNATPYLVYWNVANNPAIANSRIIRVITEWTDRGQLKNTVVEYVRPNTL